MTIWSGYLRLSSHEISVHGQHETEGVRQGQAAYVSFAQAIEVVK